MVDATVGYNVEAYGPVVRRSDGDPEWSSSSSTTATDSTTSDGQTGTGSSTSTSDVASSTSSSGSGGSDGGLSVGASAGIGVGVAVGCIIFISCIVAAYIIGKRRRAAAAQGPDGPESPPHRDGIPVANQTVELTGTEYKPWELPGGYQQVPEMDGHGYRSEMDGNNNHPIELQGSERHGRYG